MENRGRRNSTVERTIVLINLCYLKCVRCVWFVQINWFQFQKERNQYGLCHWEVLSLWGRNTLWVFGRSSGGEYKGGNGNFVPRAQEDKQSVSREQGSVLRIRTWMTLVRTGNLYMRSRELIRAKEGSCSIIRQYGGGVLMSKQWLR